MALLYLLASAIVDLALVRIDAQPLTVGSQLKARPAAALEGAFQVDASVVAAAVVHQALVKVDTGIGFGVKDEACASQCHFGRTVID